MPCFGCLLGGESVSGDGLRFVSVALVLLLLLLLLLLCVCSWLFTGLLLLCVLCVGFCCVLSVYILCKRGLVGHVAFVRAGVVKPLLWAARVLFCAFSGRCLKVRQTCEYTHMVGCEILK